MKPFVVDQREKYLILQSGVSTSTSPVGTHQTGGSAFRETKAINPVLVVCQRRTNKEGVPRFEQNQLQLISYSIYFANLVKR